MNNSWLQSIMKQIQALSKIILVPGAPEPYNSMATPLNAIPLDQKKHRFNKLVALCKEAGINQEAIKEAFSSVAPDRLSTWCDTQKTIQPIIWMWKYRLASAILHMLAGESGGGKSMTAQRIANSFISGIPWPDGTPFTGETGRVLWLDTEYTQALNIERAQKWGMPLDKFVNPFEDPLKIVELQNPDHQTAICQRIIDFGIKLVVLDSLRGSHKGDENSSDIMSTIGFLAGIAQRFNIPVIFIHHLRKASKGERGEVTLDRVRGSSAIPQIPRIVWAVDAPNPKDKEHKRLNVIKNNFARLPDPLGFRISETGIDFCEAPQASTKTALDEEIEEWLISLFQEVGFQPIPAKDIQEQALLNGFGWRTVNNVKKALRIIAKKEGKKWSWYMPSINPSVSQNTANVNDILPGGGKETSSDVEEVDWEDQ